MATTGVLTGTGASIAGSANRTRVMATTGVLTGPGSSIVGSANRTRVMTTTGVLTGQSSSIVGSANRTRVMATTGVLTGPGASIVGSAARLGAAITHDTSGAIVGAGSVVVGSAAKLTLHTTTGTLVGAGSRIVGVAQNGLTVPSQSGASRLVRSKPVKQVVNRQWLAEITAELNGMNKAEPAPEVIQVVAQALETLVEQPDGSYIVGGTKKAAKKVEKDVPAIKEAYNKPLQHVNVAHTTAIFINMIQASPVDVWAEAKVLETLKAAIAKQQQDEEDEWLIEAAMMMLI
jgi:hypothetical protein